MSEKHVDVSVDLHQVAKEHITISVQYKNIWRFRIGLLFLKLGCWLTGAQFVDEFPMSLYQEDKDVL